MARLSAEIAERLRPYEAVLQRLETIPGMKRRVAEVILAEIGPDMQRFPSAQHASSPSQASVQATTKVPGNV